MYISGYEYAGFILTRKASLSSLERGRKCGNAEYIKGSVAGIDSGKLIMNFY